MKAILASLFLFITGCGAMEELDSAIESLKPADVQCVIWKYEEAGTVQQVWRLENKEDRHDAAVYQFLFSDLPAYEQYLSGDAPVGKFNPKKTKNPRSSTMKEFLDRFENYLEDKTYFIVIEKYLCVEEPPPGSPGSNYNPIE